MVHPSATQKVNDKEVQKDGGSSEERAILCVLGGGGQQGCLPSNPPSPRVVRSRWRSGPQQKSPDQLQIDPLPVLWSPAAQASTSQQHAERTSKSSLGAQTRDTRPLGGKKGRNQT